MLRQLAGLRWVASAKILRSAALSLSYSRAGYFDPILSLAELGIRADQRTNYRWNTEYCESTSKLRAFILMTKTKFVEMGLPRTAWVKVNCLRTAVGQFHSFMHKWGVVPSLDYECGATEQMADHVLRGCPIAYIGHHMEHVILRFLINKTRCWLTIITAVSDLCSTEVWGSKRIYLGPSPVFVWPGVNALSYYDDDKLFLNLCFFSFNIFSFSLFSYEPCRI